MTTRTTRLLNLNRSEAKEVPDAGDFFLRALAGGIGMTLATGPIGCFVVWLRVASFGAALAHTVLSWRSPRLSVWS